MSDPSADPCRQRRSTMAGRHSSLFAPKFCPNPSRGAEVLAIEPIISSVVRFAKALYLLSGTEGSNPSLTVVLSAFPLQWLIYSLSTPQSPRRNEAQRNARKCQKSFKFFSSAKTLGKPGKCVHKGPAFFTVRRTANRSYTSRPGSLLLRLVVVALISSSRTYRSSAHTRERKKGSYREAIGNTPAFRN